MEAGGRQVGCRFGALRTLWEKASFISLVFLAFAVKGCFIICLIHCSPTKKKH
jgi:hypothetical protein